jgi:hypothetical protein
MHKYADALGRQRSTNNVRKNERSRLEFVTSMLSCDPCTGMEQLKQRDKPTCADYSLHPEIEAKWMVLPRCKTRSTHTSCLRVCVCVCVCERERERKREIERESIRDTSLEVQSHTSSKQAFKWTHTYCCVRKLCKRLCYLTQKYKHMLCESTTHNMY